MDDGAVSAAGEGGGGQGARTLSPRELGELVGYGERTVQQWCAGRGGKSVWTPACPCDRTGKSGKRLKLNLEEVLRWCRGQGLDVAVKAKAPGLTPAGSPLSTLSRGAAMEETDLFSAGPAVLTAVDASRRFMAMVEEMSSLHRKLMASMAGLKGVHLTGDAAAALRGALEGRGVEVDAARLTAAVEEAGLYLGPPVVVDVSGSLLNQLVQAMGKAEQASRLQHQAHLDELERRGTTMDRETAVRICTGAAGAVRLQLAGAAARAVRAAVDAMGAVGITGARSVTNGDGAAVLAPVTEAEVTRVLLARMLGVVEEMGVECARVLERAALEVERHAEAAGKGKAA